MASFHKYVDDVVLVCDDELVDSLWLILGQPKLLAEPSKMVRFPGLLFDKAKIPIGSKLVCVLSSWNLDFYEATQLLERS